MFELSLHILDLVQNSVSASAALVTVVVSFLRDVLTIVIEDDGRGMDEALLSRVTSPFATTRTTRKVGLGIPMFKQLAEMCNGSFRIDSKPGEGTRLEATFQASHMDLPPVGDLPGTFASLINGAPSFPEFVLRYERDDKSFLFDTREIRQALGGLPLDGMEILAWIHECIAEGISEVDGMSPQ